VGQYYVEVTAVYPNSPIPLQTVRSSIATPSSLGFRNVAIGDLGLASISPHQIVGTGTDFTLNVVPTGPLPVTYRWQRGTATAAAANLFNGNTDTLYVLGATTANGGTYRVELSFKGPSSLNKVIKNNTLPTRDVVVVDTVAKRFVIRGGAASPTLTQTVGGPVTNYQWFLDVGADGDPSNDGPALLSGLTARTFRPSTLTPGRYLYYCRVTGTAAALSMNGAINEILVFDPTAAGAPDIVDTGVNPEGSNKLPDTTIGAAYNYLIKMASVSGVVDPTRTATTFTAKGLPPGLRIDNAGRITGNATTARFVKDINGVPQLTPYDVTITAKNTSGTDVSQVFTLLVTDIQANLVGNFTGPVDRHPTLNGNLGGMINLTSTKTGAYTLSVTMGTTVFTGKGILATLTSPTDPITVVAVSRGKLTPLRVTFKLLANGTIDRNSSSITTVDTGATVRFDGWLNQWAKVSPKTNPAAAFAAYYTVGLDIRDGNVNEIPQGTGFASFTVNAGTGRLTVSGRLADNTAFTTATYVGAQGQVMVFRTLYSATARGSVLGTLRVDTDGDFDLTTPQVGDPADIVPANNSVVGTVNWRRPLDSATSQRTYRNGFQEDLTARGKVYAWTKGSLVMGLSSTIAAAPDNYNAIVQTLEANVNSVLTGLPLADPADQTQLDETLKGMVKTLVTATSTANRATVPDLEPSNPSNTVNPRKVSVTITPTTGLVTVRFTLSQIPYTGAKVVTRAVTASSMIIDNGSGQQAWGYFLLPQLAPSASVSATTTPILGGQLLFYKKP
jgi:hypothetical protein